MISESLTRATLQACNDRKPSPAPEGRVRLPEAGHKALIRLNNTVRLKVNTGEARERLADIQPGLERLIPRDTATAILDAGELYRIGMELFPLSAQGILSGGSATSYADRTRNRALSNDLFRYFSPLFERAAPLVSGKPKGIVPAFYHRDGSPGMSFLEMKLARWAERAGERKDTTDSGPGRSHPPLFLMTSSATDAPIAEALNRSVQLPLLRQLFSRSGIPPFVPPADIQPMIAAFTPESAGYPLGIFTGNPASPDGRIPLPGGHGQCFQVWRRRLSELENAGYRFVLIGNVDNLGYEYHPAGTAALALTGATAAFDFSLKTAVDVKGGVLTLDDGDRPVVREIGSGIDTDTLQSGETAGQPILFNCATGLFDLKQLNRQIERIITSLPVRISEQVKDAGRYSQAEQNTWDVMGLLDNVIIFMVDKQERFLAAKLLLETFLTSGLATDDPAVPFPYGDLSRELNRGLLAKTAHLQSESV